MSWKNKAILDNSESANQDKVQKIHNHKAINIYNHPDLTDIIEIIKNKFYFATLSTRGVLPRNNYVPESFLFQIDDEFVYVNYYDDFGPLNIGCLYKYCCGISHLLKAKYQHLVHYTSPDEEKRANAAYLAASYAVLYLKKTPEEVYQLFTQKGHAKLKPFQDAFDGPSSYQIKLIDCLNAVLKASSLGFFNFEDFDIKEYEKYEQLKHGDLNWIVPRKLLAFRGPNTSNESLSHYPDKYLHYFLKNDVRAVIRLNRKMYEPLRFTNAGILHYDMFFPDGGIPPQEILKHFLSVVENTKGAIAVHCKAGLGRTGTMIAAYIMKHYRMAARETIAWLRICRPGSVIGHQQTWLEKKEWKLWKDGRRYRYQQHGDENFILRHKTGIYSKIRKLDKLYNSTAKQKRKTKKQNELKLQDYGSPVDAITESAHVQEIGRRRAHPELTMDESTFETRN